jgi:hypothetical protein
LAQKILKEKLKENFQKLHFANNGYCPLPQDGYLESTFYSYTFSSFT